MVIRAIIVDSYDVLFSPVVAYQACGQPFTLSRWEELRRRHSDLPIIILSIEKDVHMRVQALHSCADDYIIKPFDMEEVLARIKVQLDHAHRMRPGSELYGWPTDDELRSAACNY